MEKITSQTGNQALSQASKNSPDPEHEIWIRAELGRLELLWGRTLGKYQAQQLVPQLARHSREELELAFRRMPDEWSAKRFQFPFYADFRELMLETARAENQDHPKLTNCDECHGTGWLERKWPSKRDPSQDITGLEKCKCKLPSAQTA